MEFAPPPIEVLKFIPGLHCRMSSQFGAYLLHPIGKMCLNDLSGFVCCGDGWRLGSNYHFEAYELVKLLGLQSRMFIRIQVCASCLAKGATIFHLVCMCWNVLLPPSSSEDLTLIPGSQCKVSNQVCILCRGVCIAVKKMGPNDHLQACEMMELRGLQSRMFICSQFGEYVFHFLGKVCEYTLLGLYVLQCAPASI